MPKKPIEWNKCISYKIWKDDDFYVGSTTDLASRKKRHKHNCNNEQSKLYQNIRENGGWDAWQMTPLEEYKECQSQIQARIREEEWRVKLNAKLNSQKCFADSSTKEYQVQYCKENKEKRKEYYIQWYQEHKEKININCDCECGGKYSKQNKLKHERTQKHQTYLISI